MGGRGRLPHRPLVVVVEVAAMHGVAVRAPEAVLLLPHGVLVHGGVGLRGGVIRGGYAVAGLAAVVTIPVVHGAVGVLVCPGRRAASAPTPGLITSHCMSTTRLYSVPTMD